MKQTKEFFIRNSYPILNQTLFIIFGPPLTKLGAQFVLNMTTNP